VRETEEMGVQQAARLIEADELLDAIDAAHCFSDLRPHLKRLVTIVTGRK
jgi:hypothetical protein